MKALTQVLMTTVGAALLAAAPARADQPSYAYVRSIDYAGTGCPAGTVSESLSADRSSITLTWDSFVAEVGPGVPLSESRKNCQIALDLGFPSGWSYSVLSTSQQGFLSLDAGVSASLNSSFYFQGQSATARLSTPFFGPYASDYQIRDTLGASQQVWSPCGLERALNINVSAQLSAANANARGLVTLESPLGGTVNALQLQWKRCY